MRKQQTCLPARRRQLHRGDGVGTWLLDQDDDRAGPPPTSDCANRTDVYWQTRVIEAPGYHRGGGRALAEKIRASKVCHWPK
jgi:hypothetical protein